MNIVFASPITCSRRHRCCLIMAERYTPVTTVVWHWDIVCCTAENVSTRFATRSIVYQLMRDDLDAWQTSIVTVREWWSWGNLTRYQNADYSNIHSLYRQNTERRQNGCQLVDPTIRARQKFRTEWMAKEKLGKKTSCLWESVNQTTNPLRWKRTSKMSKSGFKNANEIGPLPLRT